MASAKATLIGHTCVEWVSGKALAAGVRDDGAGLKLRIDYHSRWAKRLGACEPNTKVNRRMQNRRLAPCRSPVHRLNSTVPGGNL